MTSLAVTGWCLISAGLCVAAEPSGSDTASDAPAQPYSWNDRALVGMVPTMNVADLAERLHQSDNYYPIEDYLQPKVMFYQPVAAEYEKNGDPDLLPIDYVLKGIIRQKPFPEVVYFKHVTDYYQRREVLHEKIEQRIETIPAGSGAWVDPTENYAWLMLYLGNFPRVV
ncbi:MAG: hypothetical protein V3T72_03505, partial [Thermoanaerobaculia bacterium]